MVNTHVQIGRAEKDFVIKVVGDGTVDVSPTISELCRRILGDSSQSVTIDLSHCDYVDSTFLGCLASQRKLFSKDDPHRFQIIPSTNVRELLSLTKLTMILSIVDEAPDVKKLVPVPLLPLSNNQLAQHVIDCVKQLAAVDQANQALFGPIADELQKEAQREKP